MYIGVSVPVYITIRIARTTTLAASRRRVFLGCMTVVIEELRMLGTQLDNTKKTLYIAV